MLDELWEELFWRTFLARLFSSLREFLLEALAVFFGRHFPSEAFDVDPVVPDLQGAHGCIVRHPLPVGAHRIRRRVCCFALSESKVTRRDNTLRAAYSNARGIDLEDITDLSRPSALSSLVTTKKGFWFTSYAIQQNIVQSEQNPEVGWGLFTLATLSDGNPSPVKWSVLAGLGGNTLLAGRENDRWGIGFFHFGLTEPLLAGLAALEVNRRSEGEVEGFYNLAITPWQRLSADLQVIDSWNPSTSQAIVALRLQTKF